MDAARPEQSADRRGLTGVELAGAAGGLVLGLYVLGGLVLAVSFAAVGLPVSSAVQQVPREGLIVIALLAVVGPAVFVGFLYATLALTRKPKRVGRRAYAIVGTFAFGMVAASSFFPRGWLGPAFGLIVVGPIASFTLLERGATGRNRALRLFASGAAIATLVSLTWAYEEPRVWLDVATAFDSKHKKITSGYFVGEDGDAFYLARPGPKPDDARLRREVRAPKTRRLIALGREDVAELRITSAPDVDEPNNSAADRLRTLLERLP